MYEYGTQPFGVQLQAGTQCKSMDVSLSCAAASRHACKGMDHGLKRVQRVSSATERLAEVT